MKIIQASKHQAREIAKYIMLAMNYECCQNLAGPHHTLIDFEDLLTELVALEKSQYSYTNTLVALNDEDEVIGVCVSYDGAQLHDLRQPFVDAALKKFDIDYQNQIDEADNDELYIDSLAVNPDYRRQGIAKRLILESITKAESMGIHKIGLLVDKDNPLAEKLYVAQGFKYVGDTTWGGHPMKHLQYHATFFS